MKKRLFAILLALTLALSLLPTAVFAEGEDTAGNPEEPAVQSAEAGIAVQAAHTHCYCGGSITAGDHTDHNNVGSYKACKTWSELKNSWVGKNPVAYAYLENDITADNADKLYPYLSIQQGRTLYLCLNGHKLDLGDNYIWVGQNGATLYLCDCSVQKTGTVSGGSRGCVSVDDNIACKATFNMYGGTLRDGNRTTGGGVDVTNGTMNMYGGTITENTATSDGGGIYVGTKGALNLYGGIITKNTVSTNEDHHGGGVYVESNKWSGVGKISISGSPVITGNTRTYTPDNTTTTENLYLSYEFYNSGQFPTITLGTLTKGADIGIWAGESVFSTASETDYSGYFSSDVAGYHVAYNAEKKLELKAGAAHVHSGGTATCTKKAVCETCGNEYGEINAENHTGTPGSWQSDGDNHWRVYSCCNAITSKAAHQGGTATCTKQAVCTTCGTRYGELGAHRFTEEVADKYLKSAATCTEKAVYYKSCFDCGLSSMGTADEETFVSGNILGHAYGNWTSNNDGTHSRVCSRDVSHTETDNCTGGTANCHAKAVCEVCKQAYGDLALDKHDGGTEIKNAKAATCTEKGYTGDTYCKGCGEKLADGKDIPAAGHKLKHVAAKNPTTFVAGNIEYWYCTVCGKYFRDAAATKEITKEATVTHKESAPIQGNKTVESSKTGDPGVMLYAGMAVLSLTGCAWLRRKEK